MGSKRFGGVRFEAYSDDHLPPHVHGFYAGIEVIVELMDGDTQLARRDDAVRPANCKRSAVKHILNTAADHADDLLNLWRVARG